MQHNRRNSLSLRMITWMTAALMLCLAGTPVLAASRIEIVGPAGSRTFGDEVVALPNGNIVVTDPYYGTPGGAPNVGAVYLYNGANGALISTLTGSNAYDGVGSGGVTVLSNGNYVVVSPDWNNGDIVGAGAATWVNGVTGLTGIVSATNSLVGGKNDDQVGEDVGSSSVKVLSNGNYLVMSPGWNNAAGAVTWGNGTTGITGTVSAHNSLVGRTTSDLVGLYVTVLPNSDYVVRSPKWDNGEATDAGAVTKGLGSIGRSGEVSAFNSLVGSSTNDMVGEEDVVILNNGNYVVVSPKWDNGAASDAGAVTWVDDTVFGEIRSFISLIGDTTDDRIGGGGVTVLSNGNYVVSSPDWNNGDKFNVGAVTWGDKSTGVHGLVSANNSLIGRTDGDRSGLRVIALSNGHYVVGSPNWDDAQKDFYEPELGWFYRHIEDAGAATWGNGSVGLSGVITASNSLIGSTKFDHVGTEITALTNGNYVVGSPYWDNDVEYGPGVLHMHNAGAATWVNGAIGQSGVVSTSNSLVGEYFDDHVGTEITALTNGNYVVVSPQWNNADIDNAGAVTFGDGSSGVRGVINQNNSLVGGTPDDWVGGKPGHWVDASDVITLPNGNYLVMSPGWNNAAGAVTWGNGNSGVKGVVSAFNSLVGGTEGDQVGLGSYSVRVLNTGNYLVNSPEWNNAGATRAGAVTWGNGNSGVSGAVSSSNSLVGVVSNEQVGEQNLVKILSNGHYAVSIPGWDNGAATDAGALACGNGAIGLSGVVGTSNSLVGSTTNDQIGPVVSVVGYHVPDLKNADGCVVVSPYWDNGTVVDAGAVTWTSLLVDHSGLISRTNSVLGTESEGGLSFDVSFDAFHDQLVVGYSVNNKVTLLRRTNGTTETTTTQLAPDTPATLWSSDNAVILEFPVGAVDSSTSLAVTKQSGAQQPIGNFSFAGNAFTVIATNANGAPVTTFSQPYTLTVNYSDSDWQGAGIANEADLNLYFWNGSAWTAILPCAGCTHDTEGNGIVAVLDHLTEFALLGKQSEHKVHLPLVQR